MVQAYVIDTTIMIQEYIVDVHTANVDALFDSVIAGASSLHVPEFCLLECTNILWKKVRFSGLAAVAARQGIQDLKAASVTIHNAGDYLPRAFEIGLTHQLAIYDAVFITLAETLRYPLITDDEPPKL